MKRVAAFWSWFMIGLLSGALMEVRAGDNANTEILNYQGGLRNGIGKFQLKEKQMKQVIASLEEKTGFQEIHFAEDGFLSLGDRAQVVGGSATARQLLIDAVDGTAQLHLENHSYSSKVVFAHLGKSTLYLNMRTKAQIEQQPIRIDFTDFGKLVGRKEVLASFDLGMTILHELVHGVRKLHDSVNEWEEIGDCERYVNTIRKELGLPERQQYVARSHTVISSVGWKSTIAELQFARTDFRDGKRKTDEFKLSWDVNRVGIGEQTTINTKITTAAKRPEQRSSAAIQ